MSSNGNSLTNGKASKKRRRHGDAFFATRFSEIDRNQSREPRGAIRKIAEAALAHDVEPRCES